MIEKTLGQIGYEAYCKTTGWKSLVSGADLPAYEGLNSPIQDAWEKAGQAVASAVGRADAILGLVAEALAVGDVVWLQSGGPAMTICSILNIGSSAPVNTPATVFCKWFNDDSIPYEGHFAPESLTSRNAAIMQPSVHAGMGQPNQNISAAHQNTAKAASAKSE